MASLSTFNTLQQKPLFSITLCKYPSSSLSFKSHYLISHVFTISTLKHKFHQQLPSLSTLKATVNNTTNAKMSSVEHKQSINTINSSTYGELSNGFSSLKSRDEKVERKTKISSVVEEKMGKKYRKDGYVRKDVESKRKGEMGSGVSSSKSRDGKAERLSKKAEVRKIVDEKIEKVSKESSQVRKENINKNFNRSKGDNQVGLGEGKMEKKAKKNKVQTPELQLRVGLDMCSKRGDFLGAISLYDSAQREGIELGQYHYTVLLYLCSSAAVGIVRPAKSGSGSRSFDNKNLTNEVSSVNSVELSEGVLIDSSRSHGSSAEEMEELNSNEFVDSVKLSDNGCINEKANGKEGLENNLNKKSAYTNPQISNGFITLGNDEDNSVRGREGSSKQEDRKIEVSEDVKRYALTRGFEIYEKMCLENIPLNEATLTSVARMAMSMGNGNMAFEMVNKMKELGINPRLRSYGPALFTFCNNGDIEKAFMVEEHMLENGVYPEEPELDALLRLSIEAGRGDKVYYLLHKLRTNVRQVLPPTADLIEKWFRSKAASRVGKKKWDQRLMVEAMENGGGGWHGQGWLGKGKWTIACTFVGTDGVCESCGAKLVTIDLDPTETENFAKSVASIAAKRERNSSFQNFQKWLDYYGPFEAVVDAANVGLFSQRKFSPSKVNAIVNGIRQKLPSKKWPLIVLHNKRITGAKMDEPANKMLVEKWKNADALYATPTGSNDDWYWLYAAIKFKCLLVTNDEMRDHVFQLLGNDFFPKWKERHQVHFSFRDGGPEFIMPPPCSVVIQESEKGHWHIPIVSEHGSERERSWLCATRANTEGRDSPTRLKEASPHTKKGRVSADARSSRMRKLSVHGIDQKIHDNKKRKGIYSNLKSILSDSVFHNYRTLESDIEEAEKLGGCIIDFQI